MVDQELLDLLVCPDTKQPVRPAGSEVLDRVNDAIRSGSLTTRGGEVVTQTVEEGLLREDGAVLYPVRDDIPIMLIDEAIPVPGSVPADGSGTEE